MSKSKKQPIDFAAEKAEFENQRAAFINSLPTDTKNVQDRLYKMIEYSIKRHDWYEDQKKNMLQIALGMLSVFAAFSALFAKLVYDKNIEGISIYFGLAFLISGFLTSLLLIHLFNAAIGLDHPYRKVVDIRSWYFRYNLSADLPASLAKNEIMAKKQVNGVISDFKSLITRWSDYAKTDNKFLEEDFEQVFILQLLQKYRADQLKRMSNILFRGIVITVVLMLACLVIIIFTAKGQRISNKATNYIDTLRIKRVDVIRDTSIEKGFEPNPIILKSDTAKKSKGAPKIKVEAKKKIDIVRKQLEYK